MFERKQKIYMSLMGLVIVGLSIIVFIETRFMILTDLSTKPIYHNSESLIFDKERVPIYLVTYADGPDIFFKNQHALTVSALNKGIDFILNYRRSLIDSNFIKQHEKIFKEKQGAGFWLWKPWVILDAMKKSPENSFIIYADTGFVFTEPVTPYLNRMKNHDILLVAYDLAIDDSLIQICKRDIFMKLNCDKPACWHGVHTWAGFLMLRNTPKAHAFIQEWLDLCRQEKLLTNCKGDYPPHPENIKHHYDEAILSVLYNSHYGKGDTSIGLLPIIEFNKLAFWHHRHPGREFESIHHKLDTRIRSVERVGLINNPIMNWLRRLLK